MDINFPKFIFCVLYSWMSDTGCVRFISPFKEQVYFYFNNYGYVESGREKIGIKMGKENVSDQLL